MKIRIGHVSNSSSSSFTCNVCMRTESGWDMGLQEVEMHQCENGHVFCDEHVDLPDFDTLPWQEKRDKLLGYVYCEETKEELRNMQSLEDFPEFEDYWHDYSYDVLYYDMPAEYCPICQFESLPDRDLAKWLIKTSGMSRSGLVDVIRRRFDGDYAQFRKEIS